GRGGGGGGGGGGVPRRPAEITDVERLTRVAAQKPVQSGSSDQKAPPTEAPPTEAPGLRPRPSEYGTLYAPWLVVRDPLTGEAVATPPSGHVAGVWARTDTTR